VKSVVYELTPTTQGPLYPPSEVVDAHGNFVVIGRVNRKGKTGGQAEWGQALVAPSVAPEFGTFEPYDIIADLDSPLSAEAQAIELFTLPLPLPSNNYPMTFAPDQRPDASTVTRPSYPLNAAPIPDLRECDGPRRRSPITLGQWMQARGRLTVELPAAAESATFSFEFTGLIPDSLYTVMSLREGDLDPTGPSRPGPLGVPNVFVTDEEGHSRYKATLPNPFAADGNRIINVVVLWMSYQQSYGGAIGHFGLGGDVHAQLKLKERSFDELITTEP
jgi:hypothetical protein